MRQVLVISAIRMCFTRDWNTQQLLNSNTATTPGILLPPDSSLQSSKLNASFSPDVGGGFFK